MKADRPSFPVAHHRSLAGQSRRNGMAFLGRMDSGLTPCPRRELQPGL
ncbi:hypothetical protein FLM9_1449 [Candidatus Synechococcus spongiarum]|uniref:Uncharacterized protein n=1 Tax=Candidatus Synechococcus spongiarum TaxID=431041 RepID=A0A171DHQ0_9SYNE|nr:hypothetical protein FLM9_1449 [Candidatus Synechococcus spongiarum]